MALRFPTVAEHMSVDVGVVKATPTGTDEQDATIDQDTVPLMALSGVGR